MRPCILTLQVKLAARLQYAKGSICVADQLHQPDLVSASACLITLSHTAGDGDEVLAPSSEGIDTNGIKGADVATPPGADTVTDPNGATPLQQTSMCS